MIASAARTVRIAASLGLIASSAIAQSPGPDPKRDEARRAVESSRKTLSDRKVADRLLGLFEAHEAASKAAMAFLFDDEKYPVPEKASRGWDPLRDAQPGHGAMDRLVGTALEAHSKLVSAVASALGGRADRLAPPSLGPLAKAAATPIRAAPLYSAESAFDRLAARLRVLPEEPARPIEIALRRLAEGRYAEAVEAGGRLDGLDAKLFRMAADCEVLSWNRRNPGGHSRAEQEGGRALNLYRMALGLRPLASNSALHAMARDFASEQSRLKFLGHVHPEDASRRTLRDRADRVAYLRDLGENCAGSGDAVASVWTYRSDAGHHRNLVDPSMTEFGQGVASDRSVLNTGSGAGSAVMPLLKKK